MDTQTVVDKVLQHLWDQGECSYNESGCAYRGANGTKCALGILIPDELYHPDMEGLSFHQLCRKFDAVAYLPEICAIVPVGATLQDLHDGLFGVPNFRKTLSRRASHILADYNLACNLPKE